MSATSPMFWTFICTVRYVVIKHMITGAHIAIRARRISNWENTINICKYAIISNLHMYNNIVHGLK